MFRFVLAFTFVRAFVAVPCLIVLKVLRFFSVGEIEGATLELAGFTSCDMALFLASMLYPLSAHKVVYKSVQI